MSMHQFTVPDMTCGHCVSTITKALKIEDPNAKVEISLGQHLVKVESHASAEALAQCITEAGYTPKAA
jgi:copper chaperone